MPEVMRCLLLCMLEAVNGELINFRGVEMSITAVFPYSPPSLTKVGNVEFFIVFAAFEEFAPCVALGTLSTKPSKSNI